MLKETLKKDEIAAMKARDKAKVNVLRLVNAEIKAMITAFGTGIHEEFDISKLRYHKIIISQCRC